MPEIVVRRTEVFIEVEGIRRRQPVLGAAAVEGRADVALVRRQRVREPHEVFGARVDVDMK